MTFSLLSAAYALADFAPSIFNILSAEETETKSSNTYSVTQKIVDIAKRICGVDDINDIVAALKSDPAALSKFQLAMIELEKELMALEIKDRMDARSRDLALASVGRTNTRADIMVVAAALGLIGCLMVLGFFRTDLPGEAVGIISTIAGIFGACLKDAFAFEFGTGHRNVNHDGANLIKRIRKIS